MAVYMFVTAYHSLDIQIVGNNWLKIVRFSFSSIIETQLVTKDKLPCTFKMWT